MNSFQLNTFCTLPAETKHYQYFNGAHKQVATRRKFTLLVFIVLSFLAVCSNIVFSKDKDFQSWNTLVLTKDWNKEFWFTNEFHLRLGDDMSRLAQVLIRPSIHYNFNSNSTDSFGFGYTWVHSQKPTVASPKDDHDTWQDILIKRNYNNFNILSRTRLEQRYLEGNSKDDWRFRQLLRLKIPYQNDFIEFFAIANEVFIHLNDSSKNSDNKGYGENRFYVALGTHLSPNNAFEFGYQHQHIKKFDQHNFNGHTLVIMINHHLG